MADELSPAMAKIYARLVKAGRYSLVKEDGKELVPDRYREMVEALLK